MRLTREHSGLFLAGFSPTPNPSTKITNTSCVTCPLMLVRQCRLMHCVTRRQMTVLKINIIYMKSLLSYTINYIY